MKPSISPKVNTTQKVNSNPTGNNRHADREEIGAEVKVSDSLPEGAASK